ncbi:MAG: hypothetical protein C0483_13900 [Pirellula sp.]|nr:hypothetical protein [Pirellula sp.]
MSNMQRPTSVSLTAWLVIAFSAYGIYSTISSALMMQSGKYDQQLEEAKKIPGLAEILDEIPRPTVAAFIVGFVTTIGQLVCGVIMLKGRGVGRIGFLLLVALGVAFAVATGVPWFILVPSLMIQAVLVVCMFLPSANRYFAAPSPGDEVLETR